MSRRTGRNRRRAPKVPKDEEKAPGAPRDSNPLLRDIQKGLRQLQVTVDDINKRMNTDPYDPQKPDRKRRQGPGYQRPYPYDDEDRSPKDAPYTRLGGRQDLYFMQALRHGATSLADRDNRRMVPYLDEKQEDRIPTFDGSLPDRKPLSPLGRNPSTESKTAYRRYRLMQQFAGLVAGVAKTPTTQLMYSWGDLDQATRLMHSRPGNQLFVGGFGDDNAVLWSVQPYMSAQFYAHTRLVLGQIRREAVGRRVGTMPLESLLSTSGFVDNFATWVAGKMMALNVMSGSRYTRAEAAEQLNVMVATARNTLYSLR